MKQSHMGKHKNGSLRHLRAIEIAEGALLADIAVVFQLIVHYVPFVGIFFTLLVPPLFTILVLRRGLYTAIMGMCVALFTISLIVGLAQGQLMVLEIGAGIFLGVTMKYRLHYIPLILLGVTGSAIGITSITLLSILLLGPSFLTVMLNGLRQSYDRRVPSPGLPDTAAWTSYGVACQCSNDQTSSRAIAGLLARRDICQRLADLDTRCHCRLLYHGVPGTAHGLRCASFPRRHSQSNDPVAYPFTDRHSFEIGARQVLGHAHAHQGDAPPKYGAGEAKDNTMTVSPLIDIQQITYAYPVQKVGNSAAHLVTALQNVSLQVAEGEYLALLGHNGSGKSTLARHCNALLIPDKGQVTVAGYLTSDDANQRIIRDTVGMIFQNPDNQIIATVVEDDVAWALAVRGYPAHMIRERVTNAMAAVGITHLRKLPPASAFRWAEAACRDSWCAGIAATLYYRRRGHRAA